MASPADVSYSDVFIGSWKDHSKSAIEGTNITITSKNGVILVAFLALFVQFAGQHLWGVAAFFWYQLRLSGRQKCGAALRLQQDMSIRNNGSPGQTLWSLTRIAWAWRHVKGIEREKRSKWRVSGVPILMPLMFLVLLTATGILSSNIMETNQVDILLRGDGKHVCAAISVTYLRLISNRMWNMASTGRRYSQSERQQFHDRERKVYRRCQRVQPHIYSRLLQHQQ